MNELAKSGAGNLSVQPVLESSRSAEVFARAMRHSRRVQVLKIVLPVLALVFSAIFFFYSFWVPEGIESVGLDAVTIEEGNLVMQNPSLNGFTRENLPYKVTAAVARQPIGDDDGTVNLENIEAVLPLDSENEAIIRAGGGILDRNNNKLYLDKDIIVSTSTGITAQLQSAVIDISAKGIMSEEPLEIVLDGMSVRADRFTATEGGLKLLFENNVRVKIDPSRLRQQKENMGQ